jgi:Protein of unknown function (DUF1186)
MNAKDVMKELSKKHESPPVEALDAAVELRSEVAPLMLDEIKRLLAAFDANLNAPTEKEFRAKMKQAVKKPSALFYGFFLAAEWKQKEAFRPFTELLSWPEAMLPNLLSEEVVSEDAASRILAQFYDGDPASLFKLLMDQTASASVRFWQWRTLIRAAINNQIDQGTLRSLLARAFDEMPQEQDLMVWSGWESVIIYFGFADLVPLVERAHAAERMSERTMADFNREWAYARASRVPVPGRSDRILSGSHGRDRVGDRGTLTETSHQR